MQIQNLFYGIAIFFLFITVMYFVFQFLDEIATSVKVGLSFALSILLFFGGDYLRRNDK